MGAWWWHQGGNPIDQLQRRECDFVDPGAPLVAGRFAVLVAQHIFGITALQQTPADKGAQYAPT